ncbi:MAG TPA: protein kinase [Polyangiales bacterium]|nr:protein kinase [Polyangiales bacterium]
MMTALAQGTDINQCPKCKLRFPADVAHCPMDGESLVRLSDPWLGRSIAGRYLVEEKIGGGGMGVIYRGRHQVIDRDVAIKFLHPRYTQDAKSRQRFLGEARAANQMNHEHVIDITDFGETEDGLVYLVMEYLQGRTLEHEITYGLMPPARALHIAAQTSAGLARAHELDVFHRDVKPGNVFLVKRGNDPDFVKLLDFGIARFERESRITDAGTLMGTPEYLAPEQMQGNVGPKTDLYALGCVLFEMLTGRPPFTGNMSEVLVKHLRDPPPLASTFVPEIVPELDALLMQMLSKDPKKRHRDAYHLKDDLLTLLERFDPTRAKTMNIPISGPGSQRPATGAAGLPGATSTRPPEPVDSARPTLHIPSEGHDWNQRIAEYRAQLTKLHPQGGIPESVETAMRNMEKTVEAMTRLRREMDGSARELTTKEDDLRAMRLRIGRALDELAHDESKLGRGMDAEEAELNSAQHGANGHIEAILSRPSLAPIAAKQGEKIAQEDAISIQGFMVAVDNLRTAQARVRKLQQSLEPKRAALKDLSFQIDQLKQRLANTNTESSVAQKHTQDRVQLADAELKLALAQLVSEAERVSGHIRQQRVATNPPR